MLKSGFDLHYWKKRELLLGVKLNYAQILPNIPKYSPNVKIKLNYAIAALNIFPNIPKYSQIFSKC